ncbi:hypothetical protein CSA80_00795 [Candidatus Saccharibacteria bacterium]|nr:MAG: hypothetical protein CR973_02360 [Candidatus Saccharibacteria bacterium]PID99292.1 MAG: hypothetical protein CSA80_00795 [Candidatus Saccharibacteria bacterium]
MISVNAWHGFLLYSHKNDRKQHTISQYAVSSGAFLRRHRAIHYLTSAILFVFSAGYLLPHGYVLAAVLLSGAAIFDALEVMTLNQKTASQITTVNSHIITAWLMAFCYLFYASHVLAIAKLSEWFVWAIWVSFAVLLALSVNRKFKEFWLIQHAYFCFLAALIVLAHITLLVSS